MPVIINADGIQFTFPNRWKAEKYDELPYYIRKFQHVCGGAKAVDIVALQSKECCWLIEAKDHRQGHLTTAAQLADEIAGKVRDTLAGLVATRVHAIGEEGTFAKDALLTTRVRLIVHLEQPQPNTPLFATALDLAGMRQLLKQKIGAVDPKLEVVNIASSNHLDWDVI